MPNDTAAFCFMNTLKREAWKKRLTSDPKTSVSQKHPNTATLCFVNTLKCKEGNKSDLPNEMIARSERRTIIRILGRLDTP